MLIEEACRTGFLVTVEENALQGGFGSAVLELLADEGLPVRMLRFGIPDMFVEHGTQKELRRKLGIDAESMARRIAEFADGMASTTSRSASVTLR